MKSTSISMAVVALSLLSAQALADTGGGRAGADREHAAMMEKINATIARGQAARAAEARSGTPTFPTAGEARCNELAVGQSKAYEKMVQAMVPKESPSAYVDKNTDVIKILSEQVGGGNFLGLNIGGLISSVSGKYLGSGSLNSLFNQGVNSQLASFGLSPGMSVGSILSSTAGYLPTQSQVTGQVAGLTQAPAPAAAPQPPSLLSRIFGGNRQATSSTPYQR